ncbi:MAG: hypothetical protein QOG53_3016 [Frankiales bacterium]|jgi:cytochrome P450|nr:hypothetical protein [Frankiales bacterium]
MPFALYDEMLAVGPIFSSQGRVIVVGHEAVSAMFKHPAVRAIVYKEDPEVLAMGRSSIVCMNPPRHGEMRRLMGQGFTPRNISVLGEVIESDCNRLLDLALERGELDAVADFALPLALRIIAGILGIPEAFDGRLRELGREVAPLFDPWISPEQWEITRAASAEIIDHFRRLLDERRRIPGSDLISTMSTASGQAIDVTDDELLANFEFILLAGYETTVGMIGSAVNILVDRPDVWERLQTERNLVPNVIEEVLRLESPVQMVNRTAAEDFELMGHPISKASRIINIVAAANRDPAVFADPATFVPDRDNANRHLAFIVGSHHCLGSALARLEGQIALNALLDRMPVIRRTAPPSRRPNFTVRRLGNVPIAFGS